MVNDSFTAIANPVRRRIVERLASGPATVGEATGGLGVTKPAITKHLRVLEEAGLVTRVIDGRTHRLTLNPQALDETSEWVGLLRSRWERTFAAPAQAVFDAWTSVEVLRRWWHAEHDWETPLAEVDLRVGGTIRIVMRNPVDGTEYGGSGEFTVIAPPRQLAFTWSWDDAPGRQLIELELTEHGGTTTVVMNHHGIAGEARGEFLEGWQNSFDNLDVALAG